MAASCGGPAKPTPNPVSQHVDGGASAEAGDADAGASNGGGTKVREGKQVITFPTEAEARAELAKYIAAAKDQKTECKAIISASMSVYLVFAKLSRKEIASEEDTWVRIARCAEHERRGNVLMQIASMLRLADPQDGHPELYARALLSLGQHTEAEKLLAKLVVERKTDGNVWVTAAKSSCATQDWKTCLTRANEAATLAAAMPEPEKTQVGLRAEKYRARACLYTGRYDDAQKAVEQAAKLGLEATQADEIEKDIRQAKDTHVTVQTRYSPDVPLGVYHLFGKVNTSGDPYHLFSVDVGNLDPKTKSLKVELEIPNVTERVTKSVTVEPGKTASVDFDPPLTSSFDVAKASADQSTTMNLKISSSEGGSDKSIAEMRLPVTLKERDFLPTCRFRDHDQAICEPTRELFSAWVTPKSKALESFMSAAQKRAPKGAFDANGATVPQVKAIYDELKERKASFVMDPDAFGEANHGQKTRLVPELLTSYNGQSLEGTLLYATMLESIGLKPFIVYMPGHALLAWRAGAGESLPSGHDLFYLETTLTEGASFEDAMQRGASEAELVELAIKTQKAPRADADEKEKATTLLVSLLHSSFGRIDVAETRKGGVVAQPYD